MENDFNRSRSPATEADRDGRRPHGTLEWYTLPENSLRAYAITGNKTFLDFANLWLYPSYWNKFADTSEPKGVEYLHSYIHMNTFCGAAMVYAVTGDPRYLRIVRNATIGRAQPRPTPPAATAPGNGASRPTDPSARHSTFVSTPPRFPADPGLASNSPAT